MDLPGQGGVEVFVPDVAVVDEYLYSASAGLVFARVEYIFACNVFQDDGPLENFLKLSNNVYCSASLVDPLFPFLKILALGDQQLSWQHR